MQRNGKPLVPIVPSRKNVTAQSILAEATKSGECLLWHPEHKADYGKVMYQGSQTLVHRVVFQHFYDLEDGFQVHHKCANTRCVNPEHLQRTSHAENTGEMLARKDYEAEITFLKEKVAALEAQLEREWVS